MATPVITPQQVRDVSLVGYFDALTDAQIQPCIDDVTLWYGAAYLETLTGTPGAIKYTVAHVLWIQMQWETGGIAAVVGATSRKLDGVGQRNFGFSAFSPEDLANWWTMPSPWKAKLSGILAGLPPGMTTTGC